MANFQVLQIDHVELFVPDRFEAAEWYQRVFGMKVLEEFKFWSDDPHGPLMLATAAGGTKLAFFTGEPRGTRATAGFHRVAFAVSGTGIIEFLAHIKSNPVFDEFGQQVTELPIRDHEVARSVYFCDPYGHRLEVTTYDR